MARARSFAVLIAGCMLAVADACSTAFHQACCIVVAARDFAIEVARAVVEKFDQPALHQLARSTRCRPAPLVWQARAEPPHAGLCMCPSTT